MTFTGARRHTPRIHGIVSFCPTELNTNSFGVNPIEKRDTDMEPRSSNADATYFRLCTEHILALPLVKRLHFLPALVLPAQRTLLVAAFFLATFLFGAAFLPAAFRFGAAFFLVAFLALRIETPPSYGFDIHKSFFLNTCQGKKLHVVHLYCAACTRYLGCVHDLHLAVVEEHPILS